MANKTTTELKKEAWIYKDKFSGEYEYQIPSQKFYWQGFAWNAKDARYKGWQAFQEREEQRKKHSQAIR